MTRCLPLLILLAAAGLAPAQRGEALATDAAPDARSIDQSAYPGGVGASFGGTGTTWPSSFLLLGATVHTGNGEVIENAAIGVRDGVFRLVADARLIRIDRTAYDTILDVSGRHVYPGFIASSSAIGLREIGAVRATQDDYEVGDFKPHVRSAIAFNTDSRVIATLRSAGVLSAQVRPLGGRLSGTSSVMHLDGWNWEDARLREDDALHLEWPGHFRRPQWWDPDAKVGVNEDYNAQVDEVAAYFDAALAYARDRADRRARGTDAAPDAPPVNLAFEAMAGAFALNGAAPSKKVFIRCQTAREIADAVRFGEARGLDYVLVDAHQAHEVLGLLAEHDVPVLLEQTHRLPPYADSDVDLPFRTPALLQEAGIRFGITLGSGWDAFWDARNLAYHAGTAAAYGLDREAAVAAISGNVADLLGVADTYGTIGPELDATFIVTEGDVLDMRTSTVTHAWIQGRPVALDRDPQKELYRRYLDKYGLEPR